METLIKAIKRLKIKIANMFKECDHHFAYYGSTGTFLQTQRKKCTKCGKIIEY